MKLLQKHLKESGLYAVDAPLHQQLPQSCNLCLGGKGKRSNEETLNLNWQLELVHTRKVLYEQAAESLHNPKKSLSLTTLKNSEN